MKCFQKQYTSLIVVLPVRTLWIVAFINTHDVSEGIANLGRHAGPSWLQPWYLGGDLITLAADRWTKILKHRPAHSKCSLMRNQTKHAEGFVTHQRSFIHEECRATNKARPRESNTTQKSSCTPPLKLRLATTGRPCPQKSR